MFQFSHPFIRDYIIEWSGKSLPVDIDRELRVPFRKDKIVSIIGPRRAGKTYYFYQLMQRNRENSLYLNFEDTRLIDVNFREIRNLLRIYMETSGRAPENIFSMRFRM